MKRLGWFLLTTFLFFAQAAMSLHLQEFVSPRAPLGSPSRSGEDVLEPPGGWSPASASSSTSQASPISSPATPRQPGPRRIRIGSAGDRRRARLQRAREVFGTSRVARNRQGPSVASTSSRGSIARSPSSSPERGPPHSPAHSLSTGGGSPPNFNLGSSPQSSHAGHKWKSSSAPPSPKSVRKRIPGELKKAISM